MASLRRRTISTLMVVGMTVLTGPTMGQLSEDEKSKELKTAREDYVKLLQRRNKPADEADKKRFNMLESELIARTKELCGETEDLLALKKQLDNARGELAGDPAALAKAQALRKSVAKDMTLEELEKAEETLGFSVCKKRLYDDFRSYDSWGFAFSGGAEWVSVSEIFQDSLPLIDLLVYRDFRTPRRWRGMPQLYIDAQLTNSAEALAVLAPEEDGMGNGDDNGGETETGMDMTGDDGQEGNRETEDLEVESALNFNLGLFVPLWRFGGNEVGDGLPVNGRRLRDYLGFLVEGGFRELDSQSQVDYRYYGGLRLAFNPEWYVDLLYGKTDSLESDRLELRGQFPVAPLGANSRVYLGIVANIGLDEPAGVEEDDVVRVYATWNLDVKSFFQGLGNGG